MIPYEDFGANVLSFNHFPALVKFIHAKENLSVLVHPSDGLALTSENSYGKTEMWYIVEANLGAGAEFGHSAIVLGNKGRLCTCGRHGCLEAYASASALIRDTKRSMLRNRESKMWQVDSLDRMDGRTAFTYRESDSTAAAVIARYIEALGCGITNIANVLRPDAILIGGGVSAQGDNLIKPLNEYLEKHLFGGKLGPAVPILTATLGNRAGIAGAAALFVQQKFHHAKNRLRRICLVSGFFIEIRSHKSESKQ